MTGGFKISKNSSVILTSSGARGRDLEKAATILKNGGVVIFPTDTVYGIGCRFDNQTAVDRIYQIKGTPGDQPFPILVSNITQVEKLAIISETAKKLIKKYWPGALTVILESQITKDKMGFRMPDSNLVKSMIDRIGIPIIGTSANFHGQKPLTRFKDLDPKLIELADMTISGECQKGIESTVVDATVSPPKILRQGAVKIMSRNPVIPAPAKGGSASGGKAGIYSG